MPGPQISPRVGPSESESAAERNRSPHSEVRDPPPEPGFIPFIWDEIPLSPKKKGGVREGKEKSQTQSSPPSKNKGEGNNSPKAAPAGAPPGCADGAGGGAGRALSAGSLGAALGGVGNPGRAGAGCRRRRPPFSNPERQAVGDTAKKGGKAQIRLGEENRPEPRRRGRLSGTRAAAAGGRDAVRRTAPKSRSRARPAGGRNAE